MTRDPDVVVVGGGPAGSACAHGLSAAGLHVELLERTRYETRRVGELLAPEIAGPLQAIGAWGQFKADGHLPTQGIVCCWGDEEPRQHDFLCHPFGTGWNVDRRRFDRLLLDLAADAGAQVSLGMAARRCGREGGCWTVDAAGDGGARHLRSRYLVDATGRARGLRGNPRRRIDRMVACFCYLEEGGECGDDVAECPSIEAGADGWWYANRLPAGDVVLTFMTDADLLPRERDAATTRFWERLDQTTMTKLWLRSSSRIDGPYRCAADSCWWPVAEENRIAVGDAVTSTDPLSGLGVLTALESGRLGASAILDEERGDRGALARYVSTLARRFDEYLAIRGDRYRLEQRWVAAPFWSRRQHLATRILKPASEGAVQT